MRVSSYITQKARKGAASAIEGRGLFAVAPIAADELVAIKGGHIVTTAALRSLPARLQNSEIQIADGFHLAALEEAEYEPVMLFINHSCEPNVGFAGNTVLVAMRDISPGEELTTDYALFDDHDETWNATAGRLRAAARSAAGTGSARTCSANTAPTSPPTCSPGWPTSRASDADPGPSSRSREHEVAPGTGPLRAVAIRSQVALPASRALVTSATLTDAHLAHCASYLMMRPPSAHSTWPVIAAAASEAR